MAGRLPILAAVLWPLLLGLSIALSALAAAHDTLPADTGITSWAQDLPFPGQNLADAVRAITTTEVVLAGGGVLAVLLWLRGFKWEAIVLATGLIILPLLQAGIKEAVDRPRPGAEMVDLRASFRSPSFPSGHVMSPTYLYGFVAYLALAVPMPAAPRALAAGLCGVVLVLAGPANVWLGVHWPSDVLGGYAWGMVLLIPAMLACWRFGGDGKREPAQPPS